MRNKLSVVHGIQHFFSFFSENSFHQIYSTVKGFNGMKFPQTLIITCFLKYTTTTHNIEFQPGYAVDERHLVETGMFRLWPMFHQKFDCLRKGQQVLGDLEQISSSSFWTGRLAWTRGCLSRGLAPWLVLQDSGCRAWWLEGRPLAAPFWSACDNQVDVTVGQVERQRDLLQLACFVHSAQLCNTETRAFPS